MKAREFKLNMALPDDKVFSLNLIRMKGYIRTLNPHYRPTAKGSAIKRRNVLRSRQGKAAWRR